VKKSAGLQAIEDGLARARVLGPAAARIFSPDSKTMTALYAVAEERERQEIKHGHNSCANPTLNNCFKLTVLVEEVGEVAEALQQPGQLSDKVRAHLREELIQVAAVATAWAESLQDTAHRTPSTAAPKATP
jgi:NTP pyrophosphatase (non-canonical NTP hydrolase)